MQNFLRNFQLIYFSTISTEIIEHWLYNLEPCKIILKYSTISTETLRLKKNALISQTLPFFFFPFLKSILLAAKKNNHACTG